MLLPLMLVCSASSLALHREQQTSESDISWIDQLINCVLS